MAFDPTNSEILAHRDLFDLIREGRKILYKENNTVAHIRELQEQAAARNLAATQKMMEKLAWRPRASVALFNQCLCGGCGESTTLFAGFGVEMYRRSDEAVRLVMTGSLDPAYLRSIHYTSTVTQACINCVWDYGFTPNVIPGVPVGEYHGT